MLSGVTYYEILDAHCMITVIRTQFGEYSARDYATQCRECEQLRDILVCSVSSASKKLIEIVLSLDLSVPLM